MQVILYIREFKVIFFEVKLYLMGAGTDPGILERGEGGGVLKQAAL